jgi:hypothetical protein
MLHHNKCKFNPNAERTQYSGVTNMRRYYDNDDCCIRDLHANIISINERDEWIRCGFCPF